MKIVFVLIAFYTSAFAEEPCQNLLNQLYSNWSVNYSTILQNPSRNPSINIPNFTPLEVRGHTRVNYSALTKKTYTSEKAILKDAKPLADEFKSATSVYGQKVTLGKTNEGLLVIREAMIYDQIPQTNQYHFKKTSIALSLDSQCKIQKIFYPEADLALSAETCKKIHDFAPGKQDQIRNLADPKNNAALAPEVIDSIEKNCRHSTLVYNNLKGTAITQKKTHSNESPRSPDLTNPKELRRLKSVGDDEYDASNMREEVMKNAAESAKK